MNEELGKLEIERDPKNGHIIKFTVPSEMSQQALVGMLFALADSLNISAGKFNKSSTRYSRAIILNSRLDCVGYNPGDPIVLV